MYKYETHLHTMPVSGCSKVNVKDNLEFYKQLGYDGVFITNHFLDGNLNAAYKNCSYEEKIHFYFSDYEDGIKIGEEIGIRVFCGIEMSLDGTDFLVYGLDKQWWLDHPEVIEMKKSIQLPFLMENGALVFQAHPFREDRWIDHIRLFPCVDGIEVINAERTDFVNQMAEIYADHYGKLKIAGTDKHGGILTRRLAGIETKTPIVSIEDFIQKMRNREVELFLMANPLRPK